MIMRRLLSVLAAWLFLTGAALAQSGMACNRSVVYDASTNGSTVLVAGLATRTIYVCGFNIWSAGTATVKLVSGTGTTCGTNEAALTPAYSLVTQTGIADGSGVWRGLSVPPGVDMCIKTSAGVAVQAQVYFSQK